MKKSAREEEKKRGKGEIWRREREIASEILRRDRVGSSEIQNSVKLLAERGGGATIMLDIY